MIQCGNCIKCRKPNIVVVEKDENKCKITDIGIHGGNRVLAKEKKGGEI